MPKKNNLDNLEQSSLFDYIDDKGNFINGNQDLATIYDFNGQINDNLNESNEFNLLEQNDLIKNISTNDDTADEPVSNIVKVNEYVVYLRKS